MFGRLGSAKSYASTSGNTSIPVSSSAVTSGSSLSSSVSYENVINQNKAYGKFETFLDNLPEYKIAQRKPGDVFFHVSNGNTGHTNMTSADVTAKVDSVDSVGVRRLPMALDRNAAIVFRFFRQDIADRAARLAADWANTYDDTTRSYQKDGVSYSGGFSSGSGITGRVLGAVLSSSKFGTGAQARLLKYRNRTGMAPRNVICSEMCILAYQLCMAETDPGFIKLDAKHALPSNLCNYFLDNPTHWQLVAYR